MSEYVEGSSNNKYVEIYNGTASSVNLDGYRIRVYSNGASSPSGTVLLAAHVLMPGSVYVVGHPLGTIFTPNQESGNLSHNGNDAVELVDPASARLDLIGVIGDAAYFAQDVTLVRKQGIVAGSATWSSSDWNQLAIDVHQLGGHTP
jgi:predicted extracellular nuclease